MLTSNTIGSFCLVWTSCKWNRAVYAFLWIWLLLLNIMLVRFSSYAQLLLIHFHYCKNPFYRYITMYASTILLSMDIWGYWKERCCRCPSTHHWWQSIHIPVGSMPRSGFLGRRVCPALVDTAKEFSKVVVLFYIPTSSGCAFQLLQILPNTWHERSFSF